MTKRKWFRWWFGRLAVLRDIVAALRQAAAELEK